MFSSRKKTFNDVSPEGADSRRRGAACADAMARRGSTEHYFNAELLQVKHRIFAPTKKSPHQQKLGEAFCRGGALRDAYSARFHT
jgi:hypothetical protein